MTEFTTFLDDRADRRGLTNFTDRIMRFVGDYFPEADKDDSNSLDLCEFFCALPKFEEILKELQTSQLETQYNECGRTSQGTVSIDQML